MRCRIAGAIAWAAALWFSAAALSKETAIAIPLTLAAVNMGEGIRRGGPARSRLLARSCVAL